jgi:hypothetical protein
MENLLAPTWTDNARLLYITVFLNYIECLAVQMVREKFHNNGHRVFGLYLYSKPVAKLVKN